MPNQLGNLKLRDMKLSREEKADIVTHDVSDVPNYPYGLQLDLDQDALDKLDIDLPDIGDIFFVVAIAKVRSVSEHKNDDEATRHVSLQIEQLSLDGEITKA